MTVPTQVKPSHEDFILAGFDWYGLDETWEGERRLQQICRDLDGAVEYGFLAHGDEIGWRPDSSNEARFVSVLTMAARPRRPSGGGYLEATSISSAACVAGVGLLSDNWPWKLDRGLRQDWLDQQSDLAWELADDLTSDAWRELRLPLEGEPHPFHYRESEYGWVLAGAGPGVFLGAYGRGVSAYGLGFARVTDLSSYAAGRG